MSSKCFVVIALIIALLGDVASVAAADAYSKVMKLRIGKDAFLWNDKKLTFDELTQLPEFRKQVSQWLPEQLVPQGALSCSPDELDKLAGQMIGLTCQLKDRAVAIDAVGLSVLPGLSKQQPEFFNKTIDQLNQALVGNMIPNDLPARLTKLRQSIEKVSKPLDASKQICLRATLIDRHSKLRNRDERWLLIEVDVCSRKYDHVLLNQVHDSLLRRDPALYFDDIPQPVQPHPESEEIAFEMRQPQPRLANRNTYEEIVVKSDGLKKQEREARYRFSVIDNVQAEPMQIEGIAASREDSIRLLELVGQRVAISKTYTLEELHLRLGDACANCSSPAAGKSTLFILEKNSEGYVEIRISSQ